jgi:signal transduction histidine kinase
MDYNDVAGLESIIALDLAVQGSSLRAAPLVFDQRHRRPLEDRSRADGAGRIEVLAAPKDGFVEVSVTDTGVGIAPEDQEAVFEELRQVGTADKKIEGTGLGRTLCRKFVELHGDKIWVQSQVGVGSRFTFTISAE